MNQLGQRLAEFRSQLEKSIQYCGNYRKLSEKIGVSPATVLSWTRGAVPSVLMWDRLDAIALPKKKL
jgi:transcriptional regulator with XRE-family HTH domain